MKNFCILGLFVVFCSFCLFIGCSQDKKEQAGEVKQERITEVRIASATVGRIVNTISTTGTVFAICETRIRPKISGRIDKILADEGDTVAEDQILVRLEQEDFVLAQNRADAVLGTANAALQQLLAGARGEDIQGAKAAVSQAKASLDEATADFERVKKLHEANVASKQMYDTSRARYEIARQAVLIASENLKKTKAGPTKEDVQVARARVREAEVGLQMAEQQLKDSTIQAPFSGIVAEKFMNDGEIVSSLSPSEILRLVNIDTIKIQCAIPENEMSRIHLDAEASIEVDAYPDDRFPGNISKISPVVDPASRTFKTTIEIPNTNYRLKPGMFARVQITIDVHEQAILVPRSSLTVVDGKDVVFVAENDVAVLRHVSTGLKNEQSIEILKGIQAGEQVIIEGNYGLEQGTTIHIK